MARYGGNGNKQHLGILTQTCPKRTPQRLSPRRMDLHPCRSAIACKTTMNFLGQNDIWRELQLFLLPLLECPGKFVYVKSLFPAQNWGHSSIRSRASQQATPFRLAGEQLFFGHKQPEEQPHAHPAVFEVPRWDWIWLDHRGLCLLGYLA